MTIYQFNAKSIDGNEISLATFRDKVLLIVNTASHCGYTKQYKGLQDLYNKYAGRGFEILAFPCNQFGGQEPGGELEIQSFCSTNFGVTFPLFSKIDVNGKTAHPLYEYLKNAKPGILGSEGIKWNFTRFLVDRNGIPQARFAPTTEPEVLSSEIEKYLV